MLYKIGVKFCGNCNPQINTKEVYLKVKDLIVRQRNDVELCSWDTPEITELLVICGCPVNCASRPQGIIAEVAVAGQSVNTLQCKNEDLPIEVIRALEEILPKRSDSMIGLMAIFKVKQGFEAQVADACIRIAKEVREHEKDCSMYEPYVSVENPGVIIFMEKYASLDALQNHRQMPYYKEIVPQIKTMLQEAPEVFVLNPLG